MYIHTTPVWIEKSIGIEPIAVNYDGDIIEFLVPHTFILNDNHIYELKYYFNYDRLEISALMNVTDNIYLKITMRSRTFNSSDSE
jgi:hypothetical protein